MQTSQAMVPTEFLSELYLNEEYSDVRVIVENEMQRFDFPAHSFVLMRRSLVLKTMLESDFLEGKSKTIVIKDHKAINVENFLKYLYTDTIPETCSDLCKLVKMADKYLVSELKASCEEALLDCANLQNVYKLCNFACLYSLTDLRWRCLDLIKKTAYKLLKEDDFKCLSKETIVDIVCANYLNVKKEVDVFWAVWRWGNLQLRYHGVKFSNESVVKVIGDILKHIRWHLVSEEDIQKIESLGIDIPVTATRNESDSDSDEEEAKTGPREPSMSPLDRKSFLNTQCDVLCVDKYASTSVLLQDHFKPNTGEVVLMDAVSASDSPFFVVGVLFACTMLTSFNFAKLFCSCPGNGASTSAAMTKWKLESENSLTITAAKKEVKYTELLCEFENPIKFQKRWRLRITVKNLQEGISVQMNMNGQLMKSKKGREIFVRGDVFSVKKLFLL